jgi:hypothetical protein
MLSAIFFAAACAGGPPRGDAGDGIYSIRTVRDIERAIQEDSLLLIRAQSKGGSWDGKVAATALAAQALAAVEPPVAADADAAEKGVRYILESDSFKSESLKEGEPDPDAYAVAYVLAAITPRARIDDRSGMLSQGPRLRGRFLKALRTSCTAFQRTILLSALSRIGQPKDELRAIAESLEKDRPIRDGAACPALLADPANDAVRELVRDIWAYNLGGPGPGRSKPSFDYLIDQEEHSKPYPAGPLGLSDLLWTSAGFTVMRSVIVEPERGCLFSAERLAVRVLSLRGHGGDTFANASALMALVNLRHVFEDDVPYLSLSK